MPSRTDDTPEEIRISEKIRAVRNGREYLLRFPYHPEAVAAIKRWNKVDWDPIAKIWSMPVTEVESVRKALQEVEAVLQDHPQPPKTGRAAVPADTALGRGSMAVIDGEQIMITGLGRSFRPRGSRDAVRFAYYRELTRDERARLAAQVEKEDFEPPQLG